MNDKPGTRNEKAFSSHMVAGSLLFVGFLYLIEELLFGFSQFHYFQFVFTSRPLGEVAVAVGSALASFLFCYAFVRTALASPPPLKGLCVFLFAVSSVVQYGFWRAVDRFMVSADMTIAAATPFATWRDAGMLFFDWRSILPVAAFVMVLTLLGRNHLSWTAGFAALGGLTVFAFLTVFLYTLTGSPVNRGISVSSFFQTIAEYTTSELLPSKRDVIDYVSEETPQNNVVLVIDESIRGDHLSVNGYSRPTTPFLDQFSQTGAGFYNWGVAVAGGTCSHTSNSLILTGVRPGIDDYKLIRTLPTVFQYARAMGYRTYYMDAQTNTFWNGLSGWDVIYLDSWVKSNDLGDDIQSDFRAADKIVQIVSGGTGNFIVLNKRGVHFLYEGSYPPEAGIWGPVPGEYSSQPELVKNPYDNGIRYNVNTFFERLLADARILDHTVILYTSDHSQTLFENGVSWAHCNYLPEEAMVPLILIGKGIPPVDTKFHAAHENILPTLLDLMKVPPGEHIHEYAPSLFEATKEMNPNRVFLDGALRLIDFPDP